jgi:hypothetical protein
MPEGDDVVNLATGAIERLDLDPEVKRALISIQGEIAAAYQKSFIEMVEAIQRQASALERLQTTLNLLVEKMAPEIKDRVPVALRVATEDELPDVASTVVVADPIATGYTLTQSNLAEALGLSQADVSVLVRAFGLTDDGDCAVVVRKGPSNMIVNYHPRAIERFRTLVGQPPADLDPDQKSALKRVRGRWGRPTDPTSAKR